jgi:sugar phosphate isomerase/epimerase
MGDKLWHPLVEPPPAGAPGPDAEPRAAPSRRLRLVRAFVDAMTSGPVSGHLEVFGPYGDFVIIPRDPDWREIEVGRGQADWEEVRARLEAIGYVRIEEGEPADLYRRREEEG